MQGALRGGEEGLIPIADVLRLCAERCMGDSEVKQLNLGDLLHLLVFIGWQANVRGAAALAAARVALLVDTRQVHGLLGCLCMALIWYVGRSRCDFCPGRGNRSGEGRPLFSTTVCPLTFASRILWLETRTQSQGLLPQPLLGS